MSNSPIDEFTAEKIDAIGEIQNITMGSAATAISSLLNAKVWITTPKVSLGKAGEQSYPALEPSIHVKIQYIKGISGSSLLILKQTDVQLILNQLMGLPLVVTDNFEFDEMNISAVCEVMNQMMGASSTALSKLINTTIDISTPEAIISSKDKNILDSDVKPDDYVCSIAFNLTIDGVINSEFITILSIDLANEMAERMLKTYNDTLESYSDVNIDSDSKENTISTKKSEENVNINDSSLQPTAAELLSNISDNQKSMLQNISVSDTFHDSPFTPEQIDNLQLMMNVPLNVTVKVGSTREKVKDILDYTQGTVIELDRHANEPVDIIVNGNLIAKGDVVVIDDNFAVRINEIINSKLLDTLGNKE